MARNLNEECPTRIVMYSRVETNVRAMSGTVSEDKALQHVINLRIVF